MFLYHAEKADTVSDNSFCSGDGSQVEAFSRQLRRSGSGSGSDSDSDSWDHAGVENVTQECCRLSCSLQVLELRAISGRNGGGVSIVVLLHRRSGPEVTAITLFTGDTRASSV